MRIYVVIPAHNEGERLTHCLNSIVNQNRLPDRLVLVNDRSTDGSPDLMESFANKYDWIDLVHFEKEGHHGPGSRIIEAFNFGLETLNDDFDVICKFDADLIFPEHYLEKLEQAYTENSKLGMWGGHCAIEKNGKWEREKATGKRHIRGALKSYRKSCFEAIGRLRTSIGWDTLDQLLALYNGWEYEADEQLLVKHLKPTAQSYASNYAANQGQILYKLRLDYFTAMPRALRMAIRKKRLPYFFQAMAAYRRAKRSKVEFLVNEAEGKFIRSKLSVF